MYMLSRAKNGRPKQKEQEEQEQKQQDEYIANTYAYLVFCCLDLRYDMI